tara:strand:- start:927 stop:1202 length:276 start_codon:yes stop_codon:yes gene_type:complete
MTKEKLESTNLNPEEKIALQESLAAMGAPSGESFLKRCGSIFFGTIYALSLFVFGFLFSIVAAVVLPFFLPFSYIRGSRKGSNPLKDILKK